MGFYLKQVVSARKNIRIFAGNHLSVVRPRDVVRIGNALRPIFGGRRRIIRKCGFIGEGRAEGGRRIERHRAAPRTGRFTQALQNFVALTPTRLRRFVERGTGWRSFGRRPSLPAQAGVRLRGLGLLGRAAEQMLLKRAHLRIRRIALRAVNFRGGRLRARLDLLVPIGVFLGAHLRDEPLDLAAPGGKPAQELEVGRPLSTEALQAHLRALELKLEKRSLQFETSAFNRRFNVELLVEELGIEIHVGRIGEHAAGLELSRNSSSIDALNSPMSSG